MAAPLRLALIGIGKIARDQHLPAIAGCADFELVAAVSRNATVEGVANFADIDALIASGLAVDAVSIATPPLGRHVIAAKALAAGWHVMLEKPPGATLGEVQALVTGGRTLFCSWHSRHAAGVAAAVAWLEGRRVTGGRIDWREDIRVWHPGQDWILDAGGPGVFDPGINALSILTAILPRPVRVDAAVLDIPANRSAPIAARLALVTDGAAITAHFDFLQTGRQCWTIALETDGGSLVLDDGGAVLAIDGVAQNLQPSAEYPLLYQRFAALIAAGVSDCDVRPMTLVADAFLIGERRTVDAFVFAI
jgi:D-galactose 1-dehydrogenase